MNQISTKKIFVKSYGCQMNVYDSNRIKNLFENKGYSETNNVEDADLVVLNTCHIREKAAEKVLNEGQGDYIIQNTYVEEPGDYKVSSAEHLLTVL